MNGINRRALLNVTNMMIFDYATVLRSLKALDPVSGDFNLPKQYKTIQYNHLTLLQL